MPTKLIGTQPYQVPRNADLGNLAYQNNDSVVVTNIQATGGVTGNIDSQIGVSGNRRPSVRPSLSIDFTKSDSIDPRVVFSRSSGSATYYDGTTTYRSEENELTWSQTLSNAVWVKQNVAISENAAVAPDGTITADMVKSTAQAVTHYVYQANSMTGEYTFSVYAKAGTHKYLQIAFGGADASLYANFDVEAGISTPAYSSDGLATCGISYVGNGWYRCWFSYSKFSNANILPCMVDSLDATRNAYGQTEGYFYLWGMQVEKKSQPSTYTQTTSYPLINNSFALQTKSSNTPRFDYDPLTGESKGLLLEESRTNLVFASSVFNSSSIWSGATAVVIQDNYIMAPDGTLTGSKLKSTSTSSNHFTSLGIAAMGSNKTLSVYAKAGTGKYLQIYTDYVNTDYANFDLVNGTVTATGSTAFNANITNVGGGWYRCSFATGSTLSQNIALCIITSGTAVRSENHTQELDVYIWGAQVENGTYPTAYIPAPVIPGGSSNYGTVIAANGALQTTDPGEIRYNYNENGAKQLLVENANLNHIPLSESLLNGQNLVSTSVLAFNNTTKTLAPDGLYTATEIVEGTGTGFHYWWKVLSTAFSTNTTYTMSVYLKAGRNTDTVSTFVLFYNTVGDTLSSQRKISDGTPVGNGWYRHSFTFTTGSSITNNLVGVNKSWSSYAGDPNNTYYVWGLQVEYNNRATTYIPSYTTFTSRASIGTYWDSKGTLRTAPANTPRYSYNPNALGVKPKLLLEPAATNLIVTSTVPGLYTNGVIDVVAPDGTTTGVRAPKVDGPTWTGDAINTTYCSSYFIKKYNWRYARLGWSGVGPNNSDLGGVVGTLSDAIFDFDTGTFTSRSSYGATGQRWYAQPLPGGWWRISCYFTNGNTYLTGASTVSCCQGATNYTLVGGTTYMVSTWGWQCEAGYAPSSYIPSTGSSVTRAADVYSSVSVWRSDDGYIASQVTRAEDKAYAPLLSPNVKQQWYNQAEGSLYSEFDVYEVSNGLLGGMIPAAIDGGQGATMSGICVYKNTNGNSLYLYKGTQGKALALSYMSSKTLYKTIIGYNPTTMSGSVGSTYVSTTLNTPFNTDTWTTLWFGRDYYGNRLNGHITKVSYFPKFLSSSEMISLTA